MPDDLRRISREYSTSDITAGVQPKHIELGALLRIADALEKIAFELRDRSKDPTPTYKEQK